MNLTCRTASRLEWHSTEYIQHKLKHKHKPNLIH